MKRKLTRSRTDSKIAGVCGGLAEYLSIDVNIVRAIWVISAFIGGPGFIIYFICAAIIPKETIATSNESSMTEEVYDKPTYESKAADEVEEKVDETDEVEETSYGYDEEVTFGYEENRYESDSSDYDDHYYDRDENYDEDKSEVKVDMNKGFIGLALIALGGYLALKVLFPAFSFRFFWPVILIGVGVLILFKNNDNKEID